jgi:hypothetical protein
VARDREVREQGMDVAFPGGVAAGDRHMAAVARDWAASDRLDARDDRRRAADARRAAAEARRTASRHEGMGTVSDTVANEAVSAARDPSPTKT